MHYQIHLTSSSMELDLYNTDFLVAHHGTAGSLQGLQVWSKYAQKGCTYAMMMALTALISIAAGQCV